MPKVSKGSYKRGLTIVSHENILESFFFSIVTFLSVWTCVYIISLSVVAHQKLEFSMLCMYLIFRSLFKSGTYQLNVFALTLKTEIASEFTVIVSDCIFKCFEFSRWGNFVKYRMQQFLSSFNLSKSGSRSMLCLKRLASKCFYE